MTTDKVHVTILLLQMEEQSSERLVSCLGATHLVHDRGTFEPRLRGHQGSRERPGGEPWDSSEATGISQTSAERGDKKSCLAARWGLEAGHTTRILKPFLCLGDGGSQEGGLYAVSPRQESVSLAGLRVILSPSKWVEGRGHPGRLWLFATRWQHQPREDRAWAVSATS